MSTEIAIPDQPTTSGVDLEVWARQAQSAGIYAQAVCSTLMAPVAYRGKPAEATAAILAGAELGFSPMASLRAFDNIQGVPAPKAITLRAVVLSKGHDVETVEQSATRAVVKGRRKGSDTWQTSVWDIERASLMEQFKKNPNYKTNPGAMLVARATAEVCRWIASDAIMGMPYAAEEYDGPELEARPAVRRLTAADLDAPAAIEAAEVSPAEPVSRDQQKQMFKLWADLGYGTEADRETRLGLTARFIGADSIESSDDLTAAEAEIVLGKLRERKAAQGVVSNDA
jgi:hypothetical protein